MPRYIIYVAVLFLAGLLVYIFSSVLVSTTPIRKTIPEKTAVYEKKGDLSEPIFFINPGDTCFFREEYQTNYNNKVFTQVKVECLDGKGWIIGNSASFPNAQ